MNANLINIFYQRIREHDLFRCGVNDLDLTTNFVPNSVYSNGCHISNYVFDSLGDFLKCEIWMLNADPGLLWILNFARRKSHLTRKQTKISKYYA